MSETVSSVELLDGSGKVVVFDWSDRSEPWSARSLENLVCFNTDGTVRWKAKPPRELGGPDCFTSVWLQGGSILAHTWSCYCLWLDPETGRILQRVFTK